MKFCKYCGKEISETESVCPSCGRSLKRAPLYTQAKKNVKGADALIKTFKTPKALVWIGVLVALSFAIVLAMGPGNCKYAGCKNKTVPGSDYCYSHKCAVESCNESRYAYSNYCYTHYLMFDDNQTEEAVDADELKVSNVHLSSNGSYTIAEGTIKNNSDKTVSFVKLKGAFKNSSGEVVDTDWTYAVGGEGLAPGESCKWRMSVTDDWTIEKCSVTVIDFDY